MTVIFCACLWTETESRPVNTQKTKNKKANQNKKTERGQYPAILTEQAWSIKDLLYGKRTLFSYGTQRVIPSGQDSAITAERRIQFILPADGANHIRRTLNVISYPDITLFDAGRGPIWVQAQNPTLAIIASPEKTLAFNFACFVVAYVVLEVTVSRC